jgi:hypothetical protein
MLGHVQWHKPAMVWLCITHKHTGAWPWPWLGQDSASVARPAGTTGKRGTRRAARGRKRQRPREQQQYAAAAAGTGHGL